MGEGFIDHLDQRAMAVMAGEDMAPNERSRLEDALRDNFLALRAGGTPAARSWRRRSAARHGDQAPEPEEAGEAALQGAVHSRPADLASGERPEIPRVDDGEWTVLEYHPFPFELVHVVLVPKGSSIPLRHSAAGWDASRRTGPHPDPGGRGGRRAGASRSSAPPDTARRRCATPRWRPRAGSQPTGGDGTVPVLVGHTPDGVLQAVVLANGNARRKRSTRTRSTRDPPGAAHRDRDDRVVPGRRRAGLAVISLLPIGDPIDRYQATPPPCCCGTSPRGPQAQALAAPVGAAHPGHRPRLVLPALIVLLGHLPLVQPAAGCGPGPWCCSCRARLEARRLVRGDGAATTSPHGRCAPQLPSG